MTICKRYSQWEFAVWLREFKPGLNNKLNLYGPTLTSTYMTTEKSIALTIWSFVSKAMSLLFNILSRFVTPFLPRNKYGVFFVCLFACLSVYLFLNVVAAVTCQGDFGVQENKISHCFHFLLCYLPLSDGTGCHKLSVFNAEFQASLFTLLFHCHQKTNSFSPSAVRVVSSTYLRMRYIYWYFSWQYWFWLVIHPAWYFEWHNLHVS